MKKHFQFFEAGRSMVEMLAVLAVVGLLSAAGIMFYRLAIVKHEATNIYGQVGLAYAQMLVKKSPTIQQPENARITTHAVPSIGDDVFIKVSIKDKSVCKEVISMYKGNPDFAVIDHCDE